MKKGWLVFIFLFALAGTMHSQDTVAKNFIPKPHFFSFGGKHWGIGFGKSPGTYSGLKLCVNNQMVRTNGINLSLYAPLNDNGEFITNGINFSLLFLEATKINGIAFSPIWLTVDKKMNGLFIGGIFSDVNFANGIGVNGLFQLSDQLNGFFISGIDLTTANQHGVSIAGIANITDEVAKGIAVSGIYAEADTMKGILFGGIVTKSYKCSGAQIGLLNFSHQMKGVQFGLINTIKQNPKWCRTLPLLNFHLKKYISRIDSIFNNDTLIVKKYQLDNAELKSTEAYLISGNEYIRNGTFSKNSDKGKTSFVNNFRLGKKDGNWKTYNDKGKITADDFYSDDTVVSTKKISYPDRRSCIVELQNASFSQHIEITRKDTIVQETTIKGKTRFRYYDTGKKTYLYYDTLNKYRTADVEVYAGRKSISLNNFSIKYGDTLTVFSGIEQVIKTRHDYIVPLIKKDSGVYISRGKIIGWTYRNKDSSITRQKVYYNSKFTKIRSESIWNKENIITHTFYKNGKPHHFSVDQMDTIFNKKGEIIEINYNSDDDQRFQKTFKNGKLMRFEKEAYLITYYSNGNMKWEHAEMESAVYSRYYRKNGSLKIESCAFENADYYYSRSGKLKRIKKINKTPDTEIKEEKRPFGD